MEKCVLFQTVTVCTMSMLLIACDEESHFQNDDNLTMAKTITLLSRFQLTFPLFNGQ